MSRSTADAAKGLITGPVTGGRHGWPFGAPPFDLASRGYREEEYFFEGLAARYMLVEGGERARDGRWNVEPVGTIPFKTRFVVSRPIDPADFNGTVLLSWNNVTAGFDTPVVSEGKVREGYVVVGATVQRVAIDGVGANPMGLTVWDPERYGSLSISSDDYSFDIFTQIARAVGRERETTPMDPLGGLEVDTVVAYGSSQAAARLATYVNAVHPLAGAIDGVVLGLYFGSGVPLEVGRAVVDRDDPASLAPITGGGSHLIRDDLDIPVMVVNSESETMSYAPVRQPDTDRFRFWEVAGASHAAAPDLRSLAATPRSRPCAPGPRVGRRRRVNCPSNSAANRRRLSATTTA
jgi:Alpha/beta hydrolase domain